MTAYIFVERLHYGGQIFPTDGLAVIYSMLTVQLEDDNDTLTDFMASCNGRRITKIS